MASAIALFVAAFYFSAMPHDLHAAAPSRKDSEFSQLQHLCCDDNDRERQFQSALESTSPLTFKRAKILVLYAQCLLGAEDHAADAVPLLKEALQILPSNAGVHRSLGSAYFLLGIDQTAIDAYERSIELVPDAATSSQLGVAYLHAVSDPAAHHSSEFTQERMARSEDNVRRALDLNQATLHFTANWASACCSKGNARKASARSDVRSISCRISRNGGPKHDHASRDASRVSEFRRFTPHGQRFT